MGFPDHLFHGELRSVRAGSSDHGSGAGNLVRSVAETMVSPAAGGLQTGLAPSSLPDRGIRVAGLAATGYGGTEVRPVVLDDPVGSPPVVGVALFLPSFDRRGAVGEPGALVFHRLLCDRRLESRPGGLRPVSPILVLDQLHRIVKPGHLVAKLIPYGKFRQSPHSVV